MVSEPRGEIEAIETIAAGVSVNVRSVLRKMYGRGRWRKRKGTGTVRLPNGNMRRVELHRYEAHLETTIVSYLVASPTRDIVQSRGT